MKGSRAKLKARIEKTVASAKRKYRKQAGEEMEPWRERMTRAMVKAMLE